MDDASIYDTKVSTLLLVYMDMKRKVHALV
jgi:hypothetical protein